jgi:hypothetical protein
MKVGEFAHLEELLVLLDFNSFYSDIHGLDMIDA